MEAIEGLPPVSSIADVVKEVAVGGGASAKLVESGTCTKTNGVADVSCLVESGDGGYPVGTVSSGAVSAAETLQSVQSLLQHDVFVARDVSATAHTDAPLPHEAELLAAMETSAAVEHLLVASKPTEEPTEQVLVSKAVITEQGTSAETEHAASVLEEVTTLEIVTDNVTFTTEIVVEKNDIETETVTDSNEHTNNILNELGHGMELSEALRSSDNNGSVENNNCSGGEEVFNKEELLDILEGNDDGSHFASDQSEDIKAKIDKEIALNQLSRLKSCKKTKKTPNTIVKKSPVRRRQKKKVSLYTTEGVISESTVDNSNATESNLDESADTTTFIVKKSPLKRRQKKKASLNTTEDVITESTVDESNATESNVDESADSTIEEKGENDSIVNKLVKDWDDDDASDISKSMKDSNKHLIKIEDLVEAKEREQGTVDQNMSDIPMDIPAANNTADNTKGSGDEAQPHRRHSRVIKKKIPFDPDNPPTFTKKVPKKENKETSESPTPAEKERVLTKKSKADSDQDQRAKSKSPIRKMQWKKPPPKNGNTNKQFGKRLTEVDKLLMDEGAVNMIYQLTPEAPKGKKNMRTKAEFIKKVQSSTPDGKEMKFRERKKEVKSEEGEPKKISGGKQRSSMNSSVKSPAGLEDFEAHSADDSIIYRRHSSSSYSDCMSPRRLSDVDPLAVQAAAARASREASATQSTAQDAAEPSTSNEVFIDDLATPNNTEVINKDDGLSIKDKLNKKISQALSKRKRENTKTEKSAKLKRLSKEADMVKVERTDTFKYVSLTFDQRLAEICIRKTGPGDGILVFKELEQALKKVDSMKEICVTLLTSECGGLSAKVDLTPLLDSNMEKRVNYAYEVAESIRCVQSCAATHSKLLVCGAWGACGSVALALLVLSDAALAADGARFCAASEPPAPGLAALTAAPRPLPPAAVSSLVVFGSWLSTGEAAAAGLVTRVWPGEASAVRRAAASIAAQPPQSIQLKKQLLSLRKTEEAMATLQSSLERERDLLVEYWTSVEGQDIIRANTNVD